jgi:hypothetical protein
MTSRVRDPHAPAARNIFITSQRCSSHAGETVRPFVVAGELRVAAPRLRRDWRHVLEPRLEGLTQHEREQLAAGWLGDALDHHASVAALARFILQLLSLGAPPQMLRAAHRASLDAIRHAEDGFGLASAYAGRPLGPDTLAASDALDELGIEAAVRTAIQQGCIGQTIHAMLATAAKETCNDPVIAEVLDRIASDGTRHAGLAWHFVRWAIEQAPELRPIVDASFADANDSEPPPPEDSDHGWMLVHGRASPAARRAVAARTMAQVVMPCARALLVEVATSAAPMLV